jgi:hypothetical protein
VTDITTGATGMALDVLQRFRKPRPRPGEKCEMCAVPIADEHQHVVNLNGRALMCACRPCYLLFLPGGAGGGHYKAVPDRVVALPQGTLTRGEWEGLQIPVGMAFFFFSSTTNEVHGFYPGPAGATESLLPLDFWDRLKETNPVFETMESDVEAVLIRVQGGAEPVCFIVPIDACYELVGYLRMLWKGFDGGSEARETIEEYFEGVKARAKPAPARA